ncbi:CaiB/BaiF CoA transferase family protein [Micromonospora yangpuensis]|uniref:Alpha-methylacyl-CoA racemase n=1 Tax=Micromonospora yangpuensis TaxID=683228 RepID=A0A1C6UMU3_9ACTN|nr:CaiB/BaiF CoA-transferase family protein [Micromonospora yangpuensis]GGM28150.1 CoA transferase [Micromonospora yangpuensis]SCL55365.1 alpha-methylacyl-CoA racemase [Micromonospora yangpuensis]
MSPDAGHHRTTDRHDRGCSPPRPGATGPLAGVRVVELASLAPAPFGCMVLADLGADVVRVDRPGGPVVGRLTPGATGPVQRGRRAVVLDLKSPAGVADLLRLVERADVLVEAYRPGVAERLGLGPRVCRDRNPRLVYARMTGWGQDGPLATRAGHDIDYIAVAGALEPLGRAGDRPYAPANLLGDFAGGGMLLVTGVLAALLERERSGVGQVVDVAMVDGSALLTTFLHGLVDAGQWSAPRGHNLLDGGAPFYDTYRTADDRFVAVGALEPAFYAALLTGLGLADAADLPDQYDRAGWPELRRRFAERFAARTRDEWTGVFADSDACVAPVLTPTEAHRHPHNAARHTFVEVGGVRQPAPAPRFDRTPTATPRPAPDPARDRVGLSAVLAGWPARR